MSSLFFSSTSISYHLLTFFFAGKKVFFGGIKFDDLKSQESIAKNKEKLAELKKQRILIFKQEIIEVLRT
jgi:hypothetical protein